MPCLTIQQQLVDKLWPANSPWHEIKTWNYAALQHMKQILSYCDFLMTVFFSKPLGRVTQRCLGDTRYSYFFRIFSSLGYSKYWTIPLDSRKNEPWQSKKHGTALNPVTDFETWTLTNWPHQMRSQTARFLANQLQVEATNLCECSCEGSSLMSNLLATS